MAFNVIWDDPDRVGPWVYARTGGVYLPQISQALGQVDSIGNLTAGVVFEGFNGATVKAHIAIDTGKSLTRTFLWTVGEYAFNQLKVRKLIGLVDSVNSKALSLDLRLGFKEEGRIKDGTVGGDLVILTLTAEDYPFTRLTQDEIIRRL